MKNLVIILTFFLSLVGIISNLKARTTCNGLEVAPEINISTSFGQLSYDFNHNTQQITELHTQKNVHRESPLFTSGLATLKTNSNFEIGTKVYPLDNDNGYCVVPEVINVFVGYSTPRIYVSNELEPGSCRYNLVLLHERTHHRINIATLKYFLPIFKRAAKEIADKMQPIKIHSKKQLDKTTDKFLKDFSNQFNKVLDVFKKEVAIEQSKLDNSVNYSMEDKLCRNFNAKTQRYQEKSRQGSR